jgi:hypothetical protein
VLKDDSPESVSEGKFNSKPHSSCSLAMTKGGIERDILTRGAVTRRGAKVRFPLYAHRIGTESSPVFQIIAAGILLLLETKMQRRRVTSNFHIETISQMSVGRRASNVSLLGP